MCTYYPGNHHEPPDFVECDKYLSKLDEVLERDGNLDPTEQQMDEAQELAHGDEPDEEAPPEFDTLEEAEL